MERYVEVEPGVRLWVREAGAPDAEPLLLVMGANASGLVWPDTFVDALAARHPIFPPPHADHLAAVTAGARLVRMPTLGHALGSDVVPELAATVLRHTTSARAERH